MLMDTTLAPANAVSLLYLPSEILLRVLTLLQPRDWAQVAQTCKALRTECDSILKTISFLDLKNAGFLLNDQTFASLSNRLGTRLRRLELDCWHLSDSSMEYLPKSVEELALCGCDHHSDEILSHVAKRLDGKLRIFAWSGFGGTISAKGFEDLAVKNRGLTSFMIDSGAKVDANQAVCTVARNCPSLRELSAYNLTMETLCNIFSYNISLRRFRHKQRQEGSFHVTDATLCLISEKCPLLEELHLVDKTAADGPLVVTDTGLLQLAERASTLRILKLKLAHSSSTASEVAIMQLANFCSNLSQVEFSNFKHLGDPPIYELVQKCQNLKDLAVECSPVTNTSLELIAHYCKRLRSISLKGCKKLTDVGLKALGQCGSLESVNLGQASGLTDGALIAICNGNPCLKNLVVSYGQVSDRALKAVATCKLMQELALNNCSRVTNDGLILIAQGCPLLRYISVSYCEQISDSGVVALANGCKGILKIRLDGCRLLSNPSVRILCQANKKLRYLSLQHCTKLSDDVFHHLLSAPSLRFVDLGRGKLTTGAMDSYHLQRPSVEVYMDGRPHVTFNI